jgi:hypothetical protein
MRRDRREVFSFEQHAAFVGRLESGEHAQQGGLAAARRPKQGEELARVDVEAEPVHRGDAGKALGHFGEPHQRLARAVRPWRKAASHLQRCPIRVPSLDADQSRNVQPEFRPNWAM